MSTFKFYAIIFDFDVVNTNSVLVHSRVCKKMFNYYLNHREEKFGEVFKEFTPTAD